MEKVSWIQIRDFKEKSASVQTKHVNDDIVNAKMIKYKLIADCKIKKTSIFTCIRIL